MYCCSCLFWGSFLPKKKLFVRFRSVKCDRKCSIFSLSFDGLDFCQTYYMPLFCCFFVRREKQNSFCESLFSAVWCVCWASLALLRRGLCFILSVPCHRLSVPILSMNREISRFVFRSKGFFEIIIYLMKYADTHCDVYLLKCLTFGVHIIIGELNFMSSFATKFGEHFIAEIYFIILYTSFFLFVCNFVCTYKRFW